MSKKSIKDTNQLNLSFDLPKQSPPEAVAFTRVARISSKVKLAKTSLAACSLDQVASPTIVSSKLATTNQQSPETVLPGEDQIAQTPNDASSLRLFGNCAALVQGTPGKVEGSPNAADALSARTLSDAPAASPARSGEDQPCRKVGAGPCISLSEPTRERVGEMKTASEKFEVARTNDISLEDVETLGVGAPANDDERRLDLLDETRRAPTPSVGQLARASNEEPGRNDAAHGAVDLVSGDGSLLIPAAPNAELHADRHQIDAFAKASTKPASAKAPAACTATRNPCRSGDTLIEQHLPEISDGATVAGHRKHILESDASGSAPLDPSDFSEDQTEDGEAIRVDGLLQPSAEVDGPALDSPQGPTPQKLERKSRYDADLSVYVGRPSAGNGWVRTRAAYFRALNDHQPVGDQPPLHTVEYRRSRWGQRHGAHSHSQEPLGPALSGKPKHDRLNYSREYFCLNEFFNLTRPLCEDYSRIRRYNKFYYVDKDYVRESGSSTPTPTPTPTRERGDP